MASPLRITLSACLNPKAGRDGLQAAGMPDHPRPSAPPSCPPTLSVCPAWVPTMHTPGMCPARRRRDLSAGCPMRLRRRRGPVRPGRGDPLVHVQTAAPPTTQPPHVDLHQLRRDSSPVDGSDPSAMCVKHLHPAASCPRHLCPAWSSVGLHALCAVRCSASAVPRASTR